MRTTIRLLIATGAVLFAEPALAVECSAEKDGLTLRHTVVTEKAGTEASCVAGKERGGSTIPSGLKGHEIGLCKAGAWAFAYVPETKTSTATYNGEKTPPKRGTRVELKCTAHAA